MCHFKTTRANIPLNIYAAMLFVRKFVGSEFLEDYVGALVFVLCFMPVDVLAEF
jgi:hypothetical protein